MMDGPVMQSQLPETPKTVLAQADTLITSIRKLIQDNENLNRQNSALAEISKAAADARAQAEAEKENTRRSSQNFANEKSVLKLRVENLEKGQEAVKEENERLRVGMMEMRQEVQAKQVVIDQQAHKLKTIVGLARNV